MLSIEGLRNFFKNELRKAGLFNNEIEDFIEEWLGEEGRLFPGDNPFRYAIMYVPENVVQEIIQIETGQEYQEIVRVHFLVIPAAKDIQLNQPIYPGHNRAKNVLHEWGVYVSESKTQEKQDVDPLAWFSSLFDKDDVNNIYGSIDRRTILPALKMDVNL